MKSSQSISIKNNLTIVIPTYNESKYIEKTIKTLLKQRGIEGTRVIVADNNSKDGTRKLVRDLSFSNRKKINIELINGGSVSVGRNNGAKLVETKYILFMDGDVVLNDTRTIQNTLNDMSRNNHHLLTCKLESYGEDLRTYFVFAIFNVVNYFISIKTPFAVGTYFMVDTNMFRKFNGFNETLKHSEDYELSKKFKPQKFKISKFYVGQDDRRFKKMGYFGMIKLLIKGYLNRNNPNFFKKDVGYWR